MRVFRLSVFPLLLVLFTLLAGCGGFHGVVTPTLTSISPATVAAGSAGFTLTATGTNFTAGTQILWDGIAQPTKVVSTTQLTTSISAAQIANAGTVAVRVMKSDTTTSGVIDFTITGTGGGGGTYSLTSISPSSIASGSPAFTLTATGVGFVNGDSITLNGTSITTSFDSATQLHATIPATSVAAAGTISVGVIDTAKNATNQLPLTVTGVSAATPPTLTSLSPSTTPSLVNPISSTAPLTLTANGSGFVSGSKVMWNGVAMTTTFVSSTQLTASIPATNFGTAEIGTSFVFVLNPDSTVSAELPFTITVSLSQNPTLVSALNAAPPNGTNHSSVGDPAFTMYLTGTLFTSGAVAYFGSTALPTTYVSTTQLTAQVPASLLAAIAEVPITVKNPSSAASNSVPYLVGMNTLFNEVSDVVWDGRQNLLYITIPSTATKTPDTVEALSPLHLTGTPTWTYQAPAGSNPDRLALSADGKYLYVGLDHSGTVQQLVLQGSQTPTVGNSISLSSYYAMDLQVSPQNSSTIAVARGSSTSIGLAQGGVAIYDGTVQRPQVVDPTTQSGDVLLDTIQWSVDGKTIYAANNENVRGFGDLYDLAVSANGVSLAADHPGVFTNPNLYIHFDTTTGQVYGDDGLVVNPTTAVQTGNFVAGGIMTEDSTLGLAYFVGQPATNTNQVAYEVQSFNLTSFAPVATLQLYQVEGIPQHMVRWHLTNQQPIGDGLAFTTKKLTNCSFSPCSVGDGRLYVIFGPFVTQTAP